MLSQNIIISKTEYMLHKAMAEVNKKARIKRFKLREFHLSCQVWHATYLPKQMSPRFQAVVRQAAHLRTQSKKRSANARAYQWMKGVRGHRESDRETT
jgi:hypothetical protein